MANPADSNLDKELSDIRREVIESRNLVIKTDNLLKSLHAEVKAVGKRQDEFQKHQWLSSVAAYFAFALIAITVSLVVSSIRASSDKHERERLEKAIADLTAQVEKDRVEQQAVQAASRRAGDAYRQMTTLSGDDRLRGADALAKLDTSRISPLEKQALTDRADALRREIGQTALERGRNAFRKNDMKGAIADLSRFMAMNPPEQEALEASYFLGVAYSLSKRYEEAVPPLARFVSGDKKAKSREHAMYLLAHSYEQTGQLDKSAETAREALMTYPNSGFANQMRARLTSVRRALGAEAASGTTSAGHNTGEEARAPAKSSAASTGR